MRKISILLLALFFACYAQAQDTASFNFMFNHVSRSVKDAARSVAFYKKVLGLKEIPDKTETAGTRWLSLGEGKALHLISSIKDPFLVNKGIHLALTTPNFGAFEKRLDSLKIAYCDWPGAPHKVSIRADGVKQVYFQDPDGYWIEINDAVQN